MITPAISVLSAIEGLEVATPMLSPFVVPLTVIVLVILFLVQRFGTSLVGALFGPVMLVWFVVIAILGVIHLVQEPHVLAAFKAAQFFTGNHKRGFLVLGAVFHSPASTEHPFFLLSPRWAQYPLVGLATLATVIASQAVISGAYSLTRQAVQLGYAPRIVIKHTSAREIGQIYIPSVNWILMFSAIGLVVAFKASTHLAAAYGVAVTATMAITTMLMAVLERERWHWTFPAVIAVTVPLLAIDLSFFAANIVKIFEGGWFPLVLGIIVITLMTTWHTGRTILTRRLAEQSLSIDDFLRDLKSNVIRRVPGTAIFMSRSRAGIPITLLHNLKHNKVVQNVVLLNIEVEEAARAADEKHRFEWEELGSGVYRLIIHVGFIEDPNLLELLSQVKGPLEFPPMTTSYFLGRETLIATNAPAMWRDELFVWMSRNASSASQYFALPPNQVIELGAQIEM